MSLLTQHMGNLQAVEHMVPPEWMETEEYNQALPEIELPPQHEMDEPPPMPSEHIENPAESEQGFLMPEQSQFEPQDMGEMQNTEDMSNGSYDIGDSGQNLD